MKQAENNVMPSATTEENKLYFGGGTTPNSKIIVARPKPNYVMYGIASVIGLLVIYKVFLNKKFTK